MEYRVMAKSDYDGVYELWLNTKGMGLNDIDDSREGIERFLDRNPSTCFVCLEGQRIIGAILCGHDGRRGHIYHTAVAEEHRHKGIGSRLTGLAMEALKDQGIVKCTLVVFRRNTGGNRFWERIGFTERPDLNYRNKSLAEIVRLDT